MWYLEVLKTSVVKIEKAIFYGEVLPFAEWCLCYAVCVIDTFIYIYIDGVNIGGGGECLCTCKIIGY